GIFSLQDLFLWNQGGSTATLADAQAAVAAQDLTYDYTFKMFENIPTADVIHYFVFGSSHHWEWNPLGSKYLWPSVVNNTSFPIFFKRVNKTSGKPQEKELDANSQISCLDADGITAKGITAGTDSAFTVPSGFDYPYVLSQWGWMGDSRGAIYAL